MKSEARRLWIWRTTRATLLETATTTMSPMQLELSISFFDIYVMPSLSLFLRERLRLHEGGGGGGRENWIWIGRSDVNAGKGMKQGRGRAGVGLHLDEGRHALEFDESSFDFRSNNTLSTHPTSTQLLGWSLIGKRLETVGARPNYTNRKAGGEDEEASFGIW
ncbi:hypothetical protein BHE74_00030084 [Ensete ventricosum]|nr:hypothetical protein BHE74_00030084 [Ensete ventricosum]